MLWCMLLIILKILLLLYKIHTRILYHYIQ
nr:MAG TPA: hypothetical protein [Inoviridae sp.]